MDDQQQQPPVRPVRRADDYQPPSPGDADQGPVPADHDSTEDGAR